MYAQSDLLCVGVRRASPAEYVLCTLQIGFQEVLTHLMKYTNPRCFIEAKSDQLLKCGEHKKGRPQPPFSRIIVQVKDIPISESSPAPRSRNPRREIPFQCSRAHLGCAEIEW